MLKKLYAEVQFEKPIDFMVSSISTGGYKFRFGDQFIQFDFQNYYAELDDSSAVLKVQHVNPDFDSFPEAKELDAQMLNSITEITEFFIGVLHDNDATCEKVHAIRLLKCSLFDAEGNEYRVPDTVLAGANLAVEIV